MTGRDQRMYDPRTKRDKTTAAEEIGTALLKGDADAVVRLKNTCKLQRLIQLKDEYLRLLTGRYLNGEAAFCELTAAAQAARHLMDDDLPPAACVGAVRGNESGTGRDYMMMLLNAWGVPAADLGLNADPDTFLDAVREHGIRYVICAIFSDEDLDTVAELHRRADSEGLRDSFFLAVCGAEHRARKAEAFRLDCPEHRAAAVAEWVADTWK